MDELTREQSALPEPPHRWLWPPSTPEQQRARRRALWRDWRDELMREQRRVGEK